MPGSQRVRLSVAGFGGISLAAALSAGVGVAVWVAEENAQHGDEDLTGMGTLIASATTFAVSAPLLTSAFVMRSGKRGGYRGRFGNTLLGATGGILFGVGATTAMAAMSGDFDVALALGLAVTVVSTTGFATLGYRRSDARRAQLAPTLAPAAQAKGLTLGLAGRF